MARCRLTFGRLANSRRAATGGGVGDIGSRFSLFSRRRKFGRQQTTSLDLGDSSFTGQVGVNVVVCECVRVAQMQVINLGDQFGVYLGWGECHCGSCCACLCACIRNSMYECLGESVYECVIVRVWWERV